MCKNKSFYFIFFEKGDSLKNNNGQQFLTKDRDNDGDNCAVTNIGAWWYKNCGWSNLNGEYLENQRNGIFWWHWKRNYYSMKRVEMKIRPI